MPLPRSFTLFLALMSLSALCQAQKTRTINKKVPGGDRYAVWGVLESDSTVRHGPCKLYRVVNGRDVLTLDAFYKNGQPDSIWTAFNWQGQMLYHGRYEKGQRTGEWTEYAERKTMLRHGFYKNGHKTGTWEYYNRDGVLLQKYDHDVLRMVFEDRYKLEENLSYRLPDSMHVNDRIRIDNACLYLGGWQALQYDLIRFLQVSDYTHGKPFEDTVYMVVRVDAYGEMIEVYPLNNHVRNAQVSAAREALSTLGNNWCSPIVDGQRQEVEAIVPVSFGGR